MKNREIFKQILKNYKEIAKDFFGNSMEYYRIHIIYEIIDEIDNQGLEMTDSEEEKLCNYIYTAYMEYDGTNINIYNIVYTIYQLINYGKMTINDILEMNTQDFCNQIII